MVAHRTVVCIVLVSVLIWVCNKNERNWTQQNCEKHNDRIALLWNRKIRTLSSVKFASYPFVICSSHFCVGISSTFKVNILDFPNVSSDVVADSGWSLGVEWADRFRSGRDHPTFRIFMPNSRRTRKKYMWRESSGYLILTCPKNSLYVVAIQIIFCSLISNDISIVFMFIYVRMTFHCCFHTRTMHLWQSHPVEAPELNAPHLQLTNNSNCS